MTKPTSPLTEPALVSPARPHKPPGASRADLTGTFGRTGDTGAANLARNAGSGDGTVLAGDGLYGDMDLVTACQRDSMASGRFDYEVLSRECEINYVRRWAKRSNIKNDCAHSMRLAGHKGLGRRMNSARNEPEAP